MFDYYHFLSFLNHNFVFRRYKYISGVPKKGNRGPGPYHFLKYGPRDLSKNVKKLFKMGASPHLREFKGRGPEIFSGLHSQSGFGVSLLAIIFAGML